MLIIFIAPKDLLQLARDAATSLDVARALAFFEPRGNSRRRFLCLRDLVGRCHYLQIELVSQGLFPVSAFASLVGDYTAGIVFLLAVIAGRPLAKSRIADVHALLKHAVSLGNAKIRVVPVMVDHV